MGLLGQNQECKRNAKTELISRIPGLHNQACQYLGVILKCVDANANAITYCSLSKGSATQRITTIMVVTRRTITL